MFEEPVPGFLPDFSAERVFCLLAFLEELGNFFETGIWFLFFLLGLFDVVEEEFIGLVVDLLSRPLRFGVDVTLESVDPIDFLSWHFKSQTIYN